MWEFYTILRCISILKNIYYCSCAPESYGNTTAFAFYTDILSLLQSIQSALKVMSGTPHSHSLLLPCQGRCCDRQRQRADLNDKPLLSRAAATLLPQEVQVRLKLKQNVLKDINKAATHYFTPSLSRPRLLYYLCILLFMY